MIDLATSSQAAVDAAAFGRVIDPIIENIVNPIVLLLFAVGLVVFAYGVFQVVWSDDGDKREAGKRSMWGGLIGMFIMMSAWGIIYFVANTLDSFR